MLCTTAGVVGIIITTVVVGGITARRCAAAVGIGLVDAVTANCTVRIIVGVVGIIIITDAVGGITGKLCAVVVGIGLHAAGTTNCTAHTTGAEDGTSSLPAAALVPTVVVG